ncbi:hypothetical protein FPV67DRAFT_1679835 [Lyophyllum atratum]|nr:hypothetical protein FPV67DRAFT_1679835 [Lyophyllum atratum]
MADPWWGEPPRLSFVQPPRDPLLPSKRDVRRLIAPPPTASTRLRASYEGRKGGREGAGSDPSPLHALIRLKEPPSLVSGCREGRTARRTESEDANAGPMPCVGVREHAGSDPSHLHVSITLEPPPSAAHRCLEGRHGGRREYGKRQRGADPLRRDGIKAYMQTTPDAQFIVPGGTLLYDARRDGRYQYFYEVLSHPLVDRDVSGPGRTLVYIQDTRKEVLEEQWGFEDSLKVPLGPDSHLEGLGA